MNLFLRLSNKSFYTNLTYKYNLINSNIPKYFSNSEIKLEENISKIHGHFRYDGYNKIKTNKFDFNTIVKREQKIFKHWKNYLAVYNKEWEKLVTHLLINSLDLFQTTKII